LGSKREGKKNRVKRISVSLSRIFISFTGDINVEAWFASGEDMDKPKDKLLLPKGEGTAIKYQVHMARRMGRKTD
jgi:hypothetical protein